ncbi:MAG: AI-2E family transporter [Firmicutes bacterium]|nr:AI-2E family transporter [Bacillota bacterium]
MKIPINKKYLNIAFHVTITFAAMYIIKIVIDFFAFSISNADYVGSWVKAVTSWFFSVFSTVLIGFIIAYVLDPAVGFFQKRLEGIIPIRRGNTGYKRRTIGTIVTFLMAFLIFSAFIFFIVQKLSVNDGENLADKIIIFADRSLSNFLLSYRKLALTINKYGIPSDYLEAFLRDMARFTSDLSYSFSGFLSSIGNWVANILIGIFISFYFLRDKEKISKKTKEILYVILPEKYADNVIYTANDIHVVFSGFIRGQMLDAAIMSSLISVGLWLIGIPYALFIGLFSGFSNIIPYFGAIMGFMLAVGSAIVSGSPYKAVYAAVYIILLQQLDSFVIIPKAVGNNVELSPVLVLIALAVGGEMFGFVGLIFAVPVFAVVKLFVSRLFYKRKRKIKNKL